MLKKVLLICDGEEWVFDLFIVSRTPSTEMFKAYLLARVLIF